MIWLIELQTKPSKIDLSTFFIDEYHSTASTRSHYYRYNVLMGNSISAFVAGSDTTRASLVGIWYYLCKYPEHAASIYEELSGIDINDANALASLPHLNAVIKETLRLAPPVMTGTSRITGPQGLQVGNVWIPWGVKVTAPKYVLHRRKHSDSRFANTVH
jgi:cytochrome P450